MSTSKKDPPSRDRAARMSPNLRPSSSSESSAGYGVRRARSVPSSPDRKFGSSAAAPAAASGSPDMYRASLSLAGRYISSRAMSSSGSGSSVHGSRTQPFPKPTLARVKSEKAATTTSQRPPALAVPASNSLKEMAKTAAAASKVPSTLQKSKLSPRSSPDKAAASLKPSTQRSPASVTARGGRTPIVSSSRAPGNTSAKKRADAANGGSAAPTSSKARSGAPQRASATSKEKEDEPSMQFEESESISTTSIEDHLHEQLPDPVDLKPMAMVASDSALSDQQVPSSDIPEQQCKTEEVKESYSEDKEVAGGNELHNGGKGADDITKNITGIVKADDESQQEEKEEAKAKADNKVWRKDEPKSNDVIEETKSKLLEERKSRVKALVGAFETVMSFKE